MDQDILNIDVTVIVDGWFGDTSRMYVAGTVPRKAERLIEITHESVSYTHLDVYKRQLMGSFRSIVPA